MERQPLCHYCQIDNLEECEFNRRAEEIATSVREGPLLEAAYNKHLDIYEERKKARDRECPFVNDIDPDYQGKSHL